MKVIDLPTSAHVTIHARLVPDHEHELVQQLHTQPGARWVLLPEQDFDHYLSLRLVDLLSEQDLECLDLLERRLDDNAGSKRTH